MILKFIKRSAAFLSLGLVLLWIGGVLFVSEDRLQKFIFNYHIIRKSTEKTTKQDLLLGDSVAHQLYASGKLDKDYLELINVQGMSMVGQYIMLRNVLETNPGQLKTVTLVYIPHSFSNDLDQPYTMTNFVLPFFTFKNLKYLNNDVLAKLARRPLVVLSLLRFFRTNNLLSLDYSTSSEPFEPFTKHKAYLSPTSIQYLKLMQQTCEVEKLDCIVRGGPVSASASLDFEEFRQQIAANGFSSLFQGYFDDVEVLPSGKFGDGVHLTAAGLADYRKRL